MKKVLIIIVIVLAVLGLAVWLGLPAGLRAMGFHPHYQVRNINCRAARP